MEHMETFIYWMRTASIVMSIALALFLAYRYSINKYKYILPWVAAWSVVAFRILVAFMRDGALVDFTHDLLTIVHDLLWLLGLAVMLEFGRKSRIYLPVAYLGAHSALSAFLYLVMDSKFYGSVLTYLFTHPLLLIVLFWYFHVAARATKYLGARIISISFLVWALAYIALGVPWFGKDIEIAGTIGLSVGFLVRVAMLVGFVMIAMETKKSNQEAESIG